MKKILPVFLLALLLAVLLFWLTNRDRQAKEVLTPAIPELSNLPTVELAEPDVTKLATPSDLTNPESGETSDTTASERRKPAPRRPGAKRNERDERTATIRGRVFGSDNKPLAGAVVYGGDRRLDWDWPLDAPAWQEVRRMQFEDHVTPIWTRTNKEGFFELSGLTPGPGRIAIRHEDHAIYEQDGLALAPDSPLLLGQILLDSGLLVQGNVLDSKGRNVSGATIGALRPERAHWTTGVMTAIPLTKTTATGYFSTSNLPAGDWQLFVHPEDGLDTSTTFAHDRAKLVNPLQIVLDQPRRVRAQVTPLSNGSHSAFEVQALPCRQVHTLPPAEGGLHSRWKGMLSFAEEDEREVRRLDRLRAVNTPVPARFQANYRRTAIHDDGTCSALLFQPGVAYTVRALHQGEAFLVSDAFSEPQMILPRDNTEDASLGLEEEPVSIPLKPTLIYQPLFTRESSKKFEGAKLTVKSDGRRTTHSRGLSDLLAVRPTNSKATQFELEVDAPGIEKTTLLVPYPKAVRTDLLPLIEKLTRAPTLRVRVTDPNGKPVPGARVFLAEALGVLEPRRRTEALTAKDGHALLRDTPNTHRNLGVSAPGYAPAFIESPFGIKEGETLKVQLGLGTSVLCDVRNSARDPVRGALILRISDDDPVVDLFGSNGGSSSIRYSDASGIAQFHGLRPGLHRFGVVKNGQAILPELTEEEAQRSITTYVLGDDGELREQTEEDAKRPQLPPDLLRQAFNQIQFNHTFWVAITKRNAGKVLHQEVGTDHSRHFRGLVTQHGRPLPDTRITYFSGDEGDRWSTTTTDKLGHFEFPWLPASGGKFELRHHDWDLPFYESTFGLRNNSLNEIRSEMEEITLRIEWQKDFNGPLRKLDLFRVMDLHSARDRRARLTWNERSSQRDFVTDLQFAPPPSPLATSEREGRFQLQVPRPKRTLEWALRLRDSGLTLGRTYFKVDGQESLLRAEAPQNLRVQSLSILRSRHKKGWIAALRRLRDASHWTEARILRVPESDDELSMGKLPWGTYDLVGFNRDGFGRPIDVEELGKTRISSRRSATFTIRQP